MYIPHLALTVLLRVLTTSSLAIDISTPTSLFQADSVHPNATFPASLHQTSNLTDRYWVECERVTYPQLPGLNPSHCLAAATRICDKLTQPPPPSLVRNSWRWVDLPGCSLGYYVPGGFGPEELPSKDECSKDIYGLIIERCGLRSQYNAGSINVEQLPSFHDPGLPMTEGYPRYVMAPERLGS